MKDANRYFLKAEVLARFRFSDAQLHRLIVAGDFPTPVMLGPRSPRWTSCSIAEFEKRAQDGMLASRDDAAALTAAARAGYAAKAASGEIREKRRATAAMKAEQQAAELA